MLHYDHITNTKLNIKKKDTKQYLLYIYWKSIQWDIQTRMGHRKEFSFVNLQRSFVVPDLFSRTKAEKTDKPVSHKRNCFKKCHSSFFSFLFSRDPFRFTKWQRGNQNPTYRSLKSIPGVISSNRNLVDLNRYCTTSASLESLVLTYASGCVIHWGSLRLWDTVHECWDVIYEWRFISIKGILNIMPHVTLLFVQVNWLKKQTIKQTKTVYVYVSDTR